MSHEIVSVPDLEMLHFKAKHMANERVALHERGRKVFMYSFLTWFASNFTLILISPVFLHSSTAIMALLVLNGILASVALVGLMRQRHSWRRIEQKRLEVQRLIDVELSASSESIERHKALLRVNDTLIDAFRSEDSREKQETSFTRRAVLWSTVVTGGAFVSLWLLVPVPISGSIWAGAQILTATGFGISLLMFFVWLVILEPARAVSKAIPTMHRRGLERRRRQITANMPISGALTSADDVSGGGELTLSAPTGGLELDGEAS